MKLKKRKKKFFNMPNKIYTSLPIIGYGLLIFFSILIDWSGISFNNITKLIIFIIIPAIIIFLYTKEVFIFLNNLRRDLDYFAKRPNTNNLAYPILHPFSQMLIKKVKDSLEPKYLNKLQKKQADVDNLQTQINPHFLHNTLDSIRGKALIHNQYEIADMTETLSRFFRYSISRKGNIVTLRDEIENIDTYIKIQKFRFGDKFELVKVFNNIDLNKINIPKLILQPIVENAIYHGIELSEKKGLITIRMTMTNMRLKIRISDNGIGMNEETLEALKKSMESFQRIDYEFYNSSDQGIALINVNKRIKLLFGKEFGLRIYSIKNIGTDVDIEIPIKSKKLLEGLQDFSDIA